jgi:nitrogen fixation/metabolism regulation signal transduction histidine kinase
MLLISLTVLAFGITRWETYLIVIGVILTLCGVYSLYKFVLKRFVEIDDYFESIKYRDFSRWFAETKGPKDMRELHKGFNLINKTIKSINSERQVQFVYLQKILEMVNVGIVAYDIETGTILWINDTMLHILDFPTFKNISFVLNRKPDVYEELFEKHHSANTPVTLKMNNEAYKVLISDTIFEVENNSFKLVVVQNIENTLNINENEAWQKLLSVMTHEIMNSIAPISSLAETLESSLKEGIEYSPSHVLETEDVIAGISSIKKRSEGLMKFAQAYRSLNKVSQVNKTTINAIEFLKSIKDLMKPTVPASVDLNFEITDKNIMLDIDGYLIEQVLINLLINAIEASTHEDHPTITVKIFKGLRGNPIISVLDNGTGIPDEIADTIFVPFFSTKKRGSGVGLSLSKEIMTLHQGKIQLRNRTSGGTEAQLQFE